jgi:hypothetical protein
VSARRKLRTYSAALILWALVFSAAVAITVYREIGWLIAMGAVSGAAYWAGMRRERSRAQAAANRLYKLPINATYGGQRMTQHNPAAFMGGAYPAAPVTEMDAVSAYPASMVAAQVIDRTADALTGLGWRKADGLVSARNAVASLTAAGQPVTLPAAITAALRAAGASQGTRIKPEGG